MPRFDDYAKLSERCYGKKMSNSAYMNADRSHLSSPHLRMVLDQLRAAGRLTELEVVEILSKYSDSIAYEGAKEIGYVRPEEQSFNPRAARIALILMNDLGVIDASVILEALSLAGRGADYNGYLNGEGLLSIRAAFLLDRARHLHLELTPDKTMLARAIGQILLELNDSKIRTLLEHVQKRLEKWREFRDD